MLMAITLANKLVLLGIKNLPYSLTAILSKTIMTY